MAENQRQCSSKLGFILAAAASAAGLGNLLAVFIRAIVQIYFA